MNKIYLIVSGEYSDYGVYGFFTDRLEAEKYCAFKNNSETYEIYSIEECDDLSKTVEIGSIKPMFEYMTFVKNDKLSSLSCHRICTITENKITNGSRYRDVDLIIYVYIDEESNEKALKISQDMYAKYKAEQLEI